MPNPTTGELLIIEQEMEIQAAISEDGLANNDDELLMLLSMGPDQYCELKD